MGGLPNQQLTDLQQRLDTSKTKLESNDSTQLNTLTRQELLGDLFYAGGLGYYTQLTVLSKLMDLQSLAIQQ